MKTLQVSFTNGHNHEIFTTQLDTDLEITPQTRILGAMISSREVTSSQKDNQKDGKKDNQKEGKMENQKESQNESQISVMEIASSMYTSVLGFIKDQYTPKEKEKEKEKFVKAVDFYVTFWMPRLTTLSTDESNWYQNSCEWINSLISSDKRDTPSNLFLLDEFCDMVLKKPTGGFPYSWDFIYGLVRLVNIFQISSVNPPRTLDEGLTILQKYNFPIPVLKGLELDSTCYDRVEKDKKEISLLVIKIFYLIDAYYLDDITVHVKELAKLYRSIHNQPRDRSWDRDRSWYDIVYTIGSLSRDNTLTQESRERANQAWLALGEYSLLPWYDLSFRDLLGRRSFKEVESEKYVFDEHVEKKAIRNHDINPSDYTITSGKFVDTLARRFEPVQALGTLGTTLYRDLLLKEFLDSLPWHHNNLFLAGGSVVDTIKDIVEQKEQKELKVNSLGKAANDIDLFILESDKSDKIKTLKIVLKRVQEHFDEYNLFYGVRGGVLTIWTNFCVDVHPTKWPSAGNFLTIQIIMSAYKTSKELLDNFDLTCCQVLYDGSTILSTLAFFKALTFQTGECKNATLRRILKYNQKGWKISIEKNDKTQLLYDRYSKNHEEVKSIIEDIKYNQLVLPKSGIDSCLYLLRKRYPELTKDLLVAGASYLSDREMLTSNRTINESICNVIRVSTNFNDYTDKDRDAEGNEKDDKKLRLNLGSFGKITWLFLKNKSKSQFGLRLWTPQLDGKSVDFHIDSQNVIFEHYKSCIPRESEFIIDCDEFTKATLLNTVNVFFNNFLETVKEEKGPYGRRLKTQEPKKNWTELQFDKTVWVRKLLNDNLIRLKERKWETAELFYKGKGLKKERLGCVGEKFILSETKVSTTSPEAQDSSGLASLSSNLDLYKVSFVLTFKVLMCFDEYIPVLGVRSITLYEK